MSNGGMPGFDREDDDARSRKKRRAKRKTPTPRLKKPDVLEALLQAVAERWTGDHTTPGVVLAWLPGPRSRWYGSICRYEGAYKKVVFKAESLTSLDDVVRDLRDQFLLSLGAGPAICRLKELP